MSVAITADAVAELRETAGWLDERAGVIAELAERASLITRQPLRTEAVKLRGRAALLRLIADQATAEEMSR